MKIGDRENNLIVKSKRMVTVFILFLLFSLCNTTVASAADECVAVQQECSPVFIFADSLSGGEVDKKVILGTHNSATSGKTVWWQRPFAWLLNLTSRCQNKSIDEQLQGGVRLFNLQVCCYKGEWHISHGLCIYKEKLFDILDLMKQYKGIVIQLYLDKNFFVGQDEEEFIKLVDEVKKEYCSSEFILHKAWIEGTDKYPHTSEHELSIEEHYWSKGWSEYCSESWLDKLPLLKRHAKRHNAAYKENCKADYLMLDFYE